VAAKKIIDEGERETTLEDRENP